MKEYYLDGYSPDEIALYYENVTPDVVKTILFDKLQIEPRKGDDVGFLSLRIHEPKPEQNTLPVERRMKVSQLRRMSDKRYLLPKWEIAAIRQELRRAGLL